MDADRLVEITEGGPLDLSDYARVSIAYRVSEVAEVAKSLAVPGGFEISACSLSEPYDKDYDQFPGNQPGQWAQYFDLAQWGFFGAHSGGQRLGSAAVAFDTPGLDMLEGRRDLAVLWDLRVDPRSRGRGVGRALFRAVELWARARACSMLKVETQNTNLPACRFYARQGCVLRQIQRFAYPELPHEIQMLWYKDFADASAAAGP